MMSLTRQAALLAIGALLFGAPAQAQKPADDQMPSITGPDAPAPLQPGDAFGEAITLPQQTIIYINGRSDWDNAFDSIVDAFKSLNEYLDKQGIKPDGPAMTIYTKTDDSGFAFRAAVPIAQAPKDPPKGDIAIGQAPSGKALKFTHRGSYDSMDETYEAITNYLDDKGIEAKDLFVEEYTGGPLKAGDNDLLVSVFVPVK